MMTERWTKERAWAWYDAHPWLRGCNFMGSDCANRIDQWQEEGFEERLATADAELALAAETGFNTIRIIPEFFVWDQDREGFMRRFDRYLAAAWRHGIACMVVLGNDCMQPRAFTRPMHLGEQEFDWGYHGGRKMSQHGGLPGVGYHLLDEPDIAPRIYAFVRDMIETYRTDERVLIWDMYNEVGNSRREMMTLPHLTEFFRIAREINPIQPLTCCTWRCPADRNQPLPEIERIACEMSDLISYHSYGPYADNIRIIRRLKEDYGRPLLNTEWLGRCLHNTVQEMFPLLYLEKIGCWNWGFVAGKYQTYEPWGSSWLQYDRDPRVDIDFTKWFHDLYRPSHRPYDPREIEIIRSFCDAADEDFARASLSLSPTRR